MLSINFTDAKGKVTKTYSAVAIKTGFVDKIMAISERASTLEDIGSEKEQVTAYIALMADLKALIVDIFGRQFTYDELQNGVEQKELMRCFHATVDFIREAVSKN